MNESAPASPSLSVVVPVYNSESTLPELVSRIERVLRETEPASEIVLVNDGSRDRSWDIIQDLAAKHPFVRGLRLMRNYGQHNALLAGVRDAGGEIVVTMDDDLQNPPEEIPALLGKIREGYDVVYGATKRLPHTPWRNLASKMTKLALQKAMGAETARHISAFRAFRTRLREAFADYRSPFVSLDVLLTWGTSRFATVFVRHETRREGGSHYTVGKLIAHAFNMITGFTTWPLHMASLTGIAFSLLGLLILLYVVGRFLIEGGSVPGFPFLASIIAIFSGAQLFTLGILGEYMARVHFRTMDRPPYIVQGRTKPDGAEK